MTTRVDIDKVNVWSDGKLQLVVNLCEKIGLRELFDRHLTKPYGRPSDIPPGIEAEILLASMCDEGYKPLSALQNYYKYKDLEGIFHYPVQLSQLHDDRFGQFLDDFYEAGCRRLFMEASSLAFTTYGVKVGNINYDTTSKVMWGEYRTWNHLEDYGDEVSYIAINFGYSKDKRPDKKQVKIGIGTTNGVVTDAKVLSGNKDDKTYNKENLEDLDRLLETMKVDRDDFYYIADSALFTATNIEKANQNGIQFITRMPDNTKLARQLLAAPLPEQAQVVEIENAQSKTVQYELIESEVEYNTHPCKVAVIYSYALEETKRKSSKKKVKKEKEKITRAIKKYGKRTFKCRADAEKESELLQKKLGSKLKFHDLEFEVREIKIRRPGKPSQNPENDIARVEFQLEVSIILNEVNVAEYLRKQCTFILCSNDRSLSGEKMLREYKTQSDVEKRFRNLKSPKYMNSVFLKTPKRVEAVVYLLLIGLMLLTIAELVVRENLKKTDDLVYGIDRRKLTRPTLTAIMQIMERIRVVTYTENGKPRRVLRTLDESCRKIIEFLGFTENDFAWEKDCFDTS